MSPEPLEDTISYVLEPDDELGEIEREQAERIQRARLANRRNIKLMQLLVIQIINSQLISREQELWLVY